MRRNLRLLAWFSFLLDFRLYGPFAIIYFAEVAGSYAVGMAVFAAAHTTAALLEVPTGILSDRLGRCRTLVLGAGFSTIAVASYAIAGDASMLLVGAVLEGVARSLFSGNNGALLHDTLSDLGEEDQYHHQFGRITSMLQVGLASGALLGGVVGTWSLQMVFAISVVPQFAAFVLSLWLVEPRRRIGESATSGRHLLVAIRYLARSPRLAWLTLAQSISFGFGEANFQFIAAFHRTFWPLWALGALRTTAHALAAVGFWFAGPIIDRFGHFRVLIFCSTYGQFAGWLGVALNNVLSPAVMTSPSLLYGVSTTTKTHLLQQGFSETERATLGSLVAFCGSVLFCIAAIGAGLIADAWGPWVALVTLLLCQIWVLPIYIGLFRTSAEVR